MQNVDLWIILVSNIVGPKSNNFYIDRWVQDLFEVMLRFGMRENDADNALV